jgi:hypothetical protein
VFLSQSTSVGFFIKTKRRNLNMPLGIGYLGSSSLQISVANAEILPSSPSNWTTPYNFYKFSFKNDQDCHIIINGGNQIFIRANQGFEMNEIDDTITSFKIVESGITFNWIGTY